MKKLNLLKTKSQTPMVTTETVPATMSTKHSTIKTIKQIRKSGTIFSNKKTEYKLSENGKSLLRTGTTDLQKAVDSNKNTALNFMYDKYLNGEAPVGVGLQDVPENTTFDATNLTKDKLELMTESIDLANQYRDKYDLPVKWDIKKVYDWIGKNALKIDQELKNQQIKIEANRQVAEEKAKVKALTEAEKISKKIKE